MPNIRDPSTRRRLPVNDVLDVSAVTASPCATTTARSPPRTSPPATRIPENSCPPCSSWCRPSPPANSGATWELACDGLRAAEAKGGKGGRRPAAPSVPAAKTDIVRTAYLEGRSIAALPRDRGVSRRAIRTAVADLMPDRTGIEQEDVLAPELPVTLEMPGKVAGFLSAAELEPAERDALDRGVTVRRGQGCTPRVSAVLAVHRGLLALCRPLDGSRGAPAVPAQRKARREYDNRVGILTQTES